MDEMVPENPGERLTLWKGEMEAPFFVCFVFKVFQNDCVSTKLFSGGLLSLQPPYPILYPFLCFSRPENATCKTELLRFPS